MTDRLMTMLTPVLALVAWTLIVLILLYVRRIPAMRRAGIDVRKVKGSEMKGSLPPIDPRAVWVADNYNHLHEQPTIFYALCGYSHLVGQNDDLNVWLAWSYVALRVMHTLVQVTTNFVPVRFLIFAVSSLVLAAIAVRNVLWLFGV